MVRTVESRVRDCYLRCISQLLLFESKQCLDDVLELHARLSRYFTVNPSKTSQDTYIYVRLLTEICPLLPLSSPYEVPSHLCEISIVYTIN